MTEKPEALMINVPDAFLQEYGENRFRRIYETMGHRGQDETDCFYHWISGMPKHDVTHVYVCFRGHVQYKGLFVDKIRNAAPFEGWEVRNWLIVTGPVVKAPHLIPQRGFRGFRYTNHLF